MISFILNLPYTIIGLVVAVVSFPKKIIFWRSHWAFVVEIRSYWWAVAWMRGARAATIGHVVVLGPRAEQGDFEHELVHIRQYRRNPFVFPLLYYIELARKGYRKNKYEVEAYQEAGNRYEDQEVVAKSQKL